ncbi:DUF885 family protein [Persicobacter diffluens]|uniref:DUF885 domain-containing protein n=1 Tax=Persicobacter diffluens TaxID=981 RepID=A0AAN4W2U7_9BACT|nr:hypothetical protein PEDI_40320 [Persicobacter diffluens]
MRFFFSLSIVFLLFSCSEKKTKISFNDLVTDYIQKSERFDLKDYPFDYQDYFKSIPTLDSVYLHASYYKNVKSQLSKIDCQGLRIPQQLVYDRLNFQLEIQIRRTTHLKAFHDSWGLKALPDEGIGVFDFGRDWYRFRLEELGGKVDRNWEGVFADANLQINQCKEEKMKLVEDLQLENLMQLGRYFKKKNFPMSDSLVRSHTVDLKYNAIVGKLPSSFSNRKIEPSAIHFLKDKPKLKRAEIEPIILKGIIPGALFFRDNQPKEFNQYPIGTDVPFIKGWSAYAQGLGKELGLYQDSLAIYTYWDQRNIRLAKMVVDLGVNYFEWSDEKVADFWVTAVKEHPQHWKKLKQEVVEAPGIYISEGLVEMDLYRLRDHFMVRDENPSHKKFHDRVLSLGALPTQVLEKNMF